MGREKANLPADVTSFVGRRQEIAEVKRLLTQSRLVTLTGPGGVGKTRLALRVAERIRRAWPDGVWLVALAELHDPGLVLPAVASVVGVRDHSARTLDVVLREHLADSQMLLVLDNCEHLAAECATLIHVLLQSCPHMRILATSRHRLGADGECVMSVPPLPVPDPDRPLPAVEALLGYESVSLLAERAAAARPGFAVSASNGEAVARLCQRLDGIPLAIELAAVRLGALSPQQVLARLAYRYGLLSRDGWGPVPRQRTLRTLIDWSYDLLAPKEQLLWARASVFAGGFELEAAEWVCAGDVVPADGVAELVAGLVDKSVVVRQDDGTRVRYRLLETIREYGRDRLREAGEEAALLRRHLDWCLRLVAQARAEQFGPDQLAWCRRLQTEHADFAAALGHCLATPGLAATGMRLATGLEFHWIVCGVLGEGRRWLRQLLAADTTPGPDRARALVAAGHLAVRQGDTADGLMLLAQGAELGEQYADDTAVGQANSVEGLAALFDGRVALAAELFEQALAVFRATGDLFGVALALTHLGAAWTVLGDTTRAEACCRESLALSAAHGERWSVPCALWTQGVIAWRRGDLRRATERAVESIRLWLPAGDDWGVAMSLELLAWVANAQGQHERATVLLGVALRTWRSMGAAVPVLWADDHERCETHARTVLGESAFDAALVEGEALAPDAAVAYVLGARPPAPPVPAGRREPSLLTPREREVAALVAEGLSNQDIAARLVIARRTAEYHVERIMTKLGFASRAQVAAWVATQARE